jgi:transcriptional regulator with XRE-family HTH domain
MVDYRTSLRVAVRKNALAKLREKKEVNQHEVEKACGLKPNVLTQYECGRINVPLPTLEKLADYYAVPVSSLLTEQSRKELTSVAKKVAAIIGAQLSLDGKHSTAQV